MKIKANYFIIVLITILVAVIGSQITSKGMTWYNTLNFPVIVPSGALISSAWTIIFILSALSAILFYNSKNHSKYFTIIALLFFNNAFLNIMWTMLFFGQHRIGLALIEILILNIVNLALILLMWKKYKTSSWLLLPYFLWVCFATYLNYSFWVIN